MTRRMLRRRLGLVVGVLALFMLAALVLEFELVPDVSDENQARVYSLGTAAFPLAVAILATLLASWFQQRSTFIESLRRLWSHIIEARLDLSEYVEDRDRTEVTYRKAYRSLSRAIDEMRGVYRNVGESREDVGFYPYEPLHDMRKTLESLGHGPYEATSTEKAKDALDQAWHSLRARFLDEFDPPEPTAPIIDQWSRDERRASGSA